MDKSILSLSIFLIAYILFVIFPAKRSFVAFGASLLLVLTNTISLQAAFEAINWNVMGIFIGTLVVADTFMESRVPAYIAEIIVNRAKNTAWALVAICVLTSFISALVENVATVLIVAPIALTLSRKLKINPINIMIAIAVSSNLQGAATLIGDPPSMLLGGFAKMNFMDFFVYKGRPSIFFAVELGAIASFIVLYLIFRRHKEKVKLLRTEKVKSWAPTFILLFMIFSLAISSFFDTGFSYMGGLICILLGMLSLFYEKFVNRVFVLKSIKALDWDTSLFLVGVFVIVGALTVNGWIGSFSGFLSNLVGMNILLGFIMLVFFAVLFSAFIDNVPFLAAMLPVALSISNRLAINPSLLLFGLLIGASVGGNITPIGASANIVACGILKKEGHVVKFNQFIKIGLPFTIVAVITASLFVWLIWSK
ncbi:MAG: SLC13 family permease [Candidatus Omnitrophota bacterium]|jgi:Na+/H+ antiporter NhaD/arsenite permease-like protein